MNVQYSVSQLDANDLDAVELLRKKNGKTLGLLPYAVLQDFLDKGCALGAKSDQGDLLGYLLYAEYYARFRIAHLCVSEQSRGSGIARRLFEALKNRTTTQLVIKLSCRRDFPAHHMWPKLGFVPVEEVAGRSAAGHPLTRWEYQLAEDMQPDLFREKASDEAIDVVVDAQIFFHFHEPSSLETDPSKALQADFLADSLDLCATDEIFVEIDRIDDHRRRAESHRRAREFRTIRHNQKLAEHFETILNEILPSGSRSQISDIRHLAKAAASDARHFITRDDGILKRSQTIMGRIGLHVLSPTQLIIQLHELSDAQAYRPSRISGVDLGWGRLGADEVELLLTDFLETGERKGVLRTRISTFLSDPMTYRTEALRSSSSIQAVRISAQTRDTLTVHLARVRRGPDYGLLARFLIADSIAMAVEGKLPVVHFDGELLGRGLENDLAETGFSDVRHGFVRLCIWRSLTRKRLLEECGRRLPQEAVERYERMTEEELASVCSPANILDGERRYLMVPIRPGYAMSLFDRSGAADDLFGWKSSVLMRWQNVYYRKKTLHNAIRPPARILWYESGSRGAVTAVSRLDAVEIGPPKDLLRKFKAYGTLDWNDLYEMCERNPRKEIMVLKFSQTFAFPCPVELGALRAMEGRRNVPLQSARLIDGALFRQVFDAGFRTKV